MQSSAPFLTLGSRGSPLARKQVELVRRLLCAAHAVPEDAIPIRIITTSGDQLTEGPLSAAGGKGLFTKEIEIALINGEIDVGVHSSKDMETMLPYGLAFPVFLEREDVRDAFVSLSAAGLDQLHRGARFGTSSIRRAAQILRHRPDLSVVPFRGNVDTRLQKLRDGVADATLLAMAGLNRLGRAGEARAALDPKKFPPAPAQGAIGLQCRDADSWTRHIIAALDHAPTRIAVTAERAMLAGLDGSCRTPIGALSTLDDDRLTLMGQILTPDGRQAFEDTVSGPATAAAAIGDELAARLRAQAGDTWGTIVASLR